MVIENQILCPLTEVVSQNLVCVTEVCVVFWMQTWWPRGEGGCIYKYTPILLGQIFILIKIKEAYYWWGTTHRLEAIRNQIILWDVVAGLEFLIITWDNISHRHKGHNAWCTHCCTLVTMTIPQSWSSLIGVGGQAGQAGQPGNLEIIFPRWPDSLPWVP